MSKEIEILDAAEPEPTPPPPMSLSGWDAIFAIRFGDVNKAIAKMEDIPQKVEASSLMKDKIFKTLFKIIKKEM